MDLVMPTDWPAPDTLAVNAKATTAVCAAAAALPALDNAAQGHGRRLEVVPRWKLPGGGGRPLADSDLRFTQRGGAGKKAVALSGVVIRVSPYRVLHRATRPVCGSLDLATGLGAPGGDCGDCAARRYAPDTDYCRERSRVYLATPDGDLAMLELSALAREELDDMLLWHTQHGARFGQYAWGLALAAHPRFDKAARVHLKPLCRADDGGAGYRAAMRSALTWIAAAETAWLDGLTAVRPAAVAAGHAADWVDHEPAADDTEPASDFAGS